MKSPLLALAAFAASCAFVFAQEPPSVPDPAAPAAGQPAPDMTPAKEDVAPATESAAKGMPSAAEQEAARPAAPADADREQDRRLTELEERTKLQDRIAELEKRLAESRSELQRLQKAHEEEIGELALMVKANAEALAAASKQIEANQELVQAMQKQSEANASVQADNSRVLRDLATQDGQGGYTLNVVGNMQKRQFQNELQQVTQGKLWIHNPGETERVVYINGTPWQARRGWSFVWVPFGKVGVTEVAGVTPALRDDWKFSEERKQYELVYDLNEPWE